MSLTQFAMITLISLISFFYVVRLPGLKMNLRDVPGIKIFLISAVWSVACVALPAGDTFSTLECLMFLSVFLLIFSLAICFDIRDIGVDEPKKRTIPQMVGVSGSKWISTASYLASVLCIVLINTCWWPAQLISAAFFIPLIWYSGRKRNEFYFVLLLDGILIVQPLVYFGFNALNQ